MSDLRFALVSDDRTQTVDHVNQVRAVLRIGLAHQIFHLRFHRALASVSHFADFGIGIALGDKFQNCCLRSAQMIVRLQTRAIKIHRTAGINDGDQAAALSDISRPFAGFDGANFYKERSPGLGELNNDGFFARARTKLSMRVLTDNKIVIMFGRCVARVFADHLQDTVGRFAKYLVFARTPFKFFVGKQDRAARTEHGNALAKVFENFLKYSLCKKLVLKRPGQADDFGDMRQELRCGRFFFPRDRAMTGGELQREPVDVDEVLVEQRARAMLQTVVHHEQDIGLYHEIGDVGAQLDVADKVDRVILSGQLCKATLITDLFAVEAAQIGSDNFRIIVGRKNAGSNLRGFFVKTQFKNERPARTQLVGDAQHQVRPYLWIKRRIIDARNQVNVIGIHRTGDFPSLHNKIELCTP